MMVFLDDDDDDDDADEAVQPAKAEPSATAPQASAPAQVILIGLVAHAFVPAILHCIHA